MFFIAGLPRSRTAWMAAFLTGGDVFCHHEALKYCTKKSDFDQFMNLPYKHVGNADSGLMISDFQERFKEAKTVVIERDVDEVRKSLRELNLDHEIDYFIYKLEGVTGLRVPFRALNDSLQDICDYIGTDYDPCKAALFRDLNIQTTDLTPRPHALRLWV